MGFLDKLYVVVGNCGVSPATSNTVFMLLSFSATAVVGVFVLSTDFGSAVDTEVVMMTAQIILAAHVVCDRFMHSFLPNSSEASNVTQCHPMPPNATQCHPMPPNATQCPQFVLCRASPHTYDGIAPSLRVATK
jgi:hypothetical protein